MAKWKCRLCGGRLVNNRCTFCGLDNSIYDKDDNYHHKFDQQQHLEKKAEHATPELIAPPVRSKAARPASPKAAFSDPEGKGASTVFSVQKQTSAFQRQGVKKRILLIIAVCIAVIVFLPSLLRLLTGAFDQIDTAVSSSDVYTFEDFNSSYTKDIPEDGTDYEIVLGCGFYKTGVHIPEGIYHAELVDGYGEVQINDRINNAYISKSFGPESEYGEIAEAENLHLYNGAELYIGSGVLVRFTTSNAQPLTDAPAPNPLTETISLPAGTYNTAEAGIPEGMYDLEVPDDIDNPADYANLVLTYPNGEEKYLWVEGTEYSVSSDGISSKGIKNVVITDRTEIRIDNGAILMIPSNGYYNIDYGDYTDY